MGFSILDPRLQFQYVYIPFENPDLAKKKNIRSTLIKGQISKFYQKSQNQKFSKFHSNKLLMELSSLDPRLQFPYLCIPFKNSILRKYRQTFHNNTLVKGHTSKFINLQKITKS